MWERHLAATRAVSTKANRGKVPLPQLVYFQFEIGLKNCKPSCAGDETELVPGLTLRASVIYDPIFPAPF